MVFTENNFHTDFERYEDDYLKVLNVKTSEYNTDILSRTSKSKLRCADLEISFKQDFNDSLKKILYIYLKYLYSISDIYIIRNIIKKIVRRQFHIVKELLSDIMDENIQYKMYQEIILNNLLEIHPSDNIKLTSPVEQNQKNILYLNIDYFDFGSVVEKEQLPLDILIKKEKEIRVFTTRIFEVQKEIDFEFILRNIQKLNKTIVNYLRDSKKITKDEYKTLLIIKEMI